ncbi:MAG: NAD(P)/FAD-dependent oxidoreductase [Candidatus Woesearchaeota archaeon]
MKVVIIGGGFAGIRAAKRLKKHFKVTLIDENGQFVVRPLLHEYIVGAIPLDHAVFPYNKILGDDIEILRGSVTSIDSKERKIRVVTPDSTASITLSYDYLLVTMGSKANIGEGQEAPHIYDINGAAMAKEDIMAIRDLIRVHKRVSVAIVGGGPVGVQSALMIKEMIEYYSEKYHDPNHHQVTIYNSTDHILSRYNMRISSIARRLLVMHNIKVENHSLARKAERMNNKVTLHYQRDDKLHYTKHDIVLWAAGKKKPSIGNVTFETDDCLRSRHDRKIFCAGDAAMITLKNRSVPELAQLALQQADTAAINIIRASRSRKLIPYKPKIRGLILSAGYTKGIGLLYKRILLKDKTAWTVNRIIYATSMFTLKNRIRMIKRWLRYDDKNPYKHLED